MRILVVAAHPDDEVLGCAGTIRLLSAEHEVHIAILGEGLSSRRNRRDQTPPLELLNLRKQAESVASFLGAKSVSFAGLQDNRFDEVPLLEVTQQVERWTEAVHPEVIYTHHPGDLNVDHAATFRAVLTATRPKPNGFGVREIYAFEVPSSTEWAFQRLEPIFRPNVFVDVSSTLEAKVQAMKIYTSELELPPHPRSPEVLRAIALRWGSVAGLGFAEAFELIRSIR